MLDKGFITEMVDEIRNRKLSKPELGSLKNRLCKKYGIRDLPTDAEIMMHADSESMGIIRESLLRKPTRTISGVAVIAMMTKPYRCPHGTCTYCPGGPDSVFGHVPQSYTGKEPSTMRSIRNHYDPYIITFNRLEQYYVSGHFPEKAEVIIQGGTFNFYHHEYQEYFVKYTLKAMNDFSNLFFSKGDFDIKRFRDFFELPGELTKERTLRIHNKLLSLKYNFIDDNSSIRETECNGQLLGYEQMNGEPSLLNMQEANETAKIRCVGLTIETKPDYGKLIHGNNMLELGCTRIEIGVQSIYNEVLRSINRGHSVEDTIDSFRILRDLGFKITAHYMPGLPRTTTEMDRYALSQMFNNPDFMPDMIKVYPCMVMKGTALYSDWKKGNFKPITTMEAAELIADFKAHVPRYCRIMRVQRDIPTYMTSGGVDRTNLRQYISKLMKEKGIKCNCIRCREAGILMVRNVLNMDKINILVEEYEASHGREFFISAEDVNSNVLYGYCRLRFPSLCLRKEITKESALVREIHVYSPAVPIGSVSENSFQHRGIGKRLMQNAEEIAGLNRKDKIVVIAGIGAREYFRKIGYVREGVYMVKRLK